MACEKLNVTRDRLNEMCPEEYYFDLMTWLSRVSGACAVWENQVMGDKFTAKQIKALQMLKDNRLYLGEIPRTALEILKTIEGVRYNGDNINSRD